MMKLSEEEIKIIIDHLTGKRVISRRKKFEQFSSGRGKILHRCALLYNSLVRELEKNQARLKARLVDEGNSELVLILEDSAACYRRETRIPREIASYLVNRFPCIAVVAPTSSDKLSFESPSHLNFEASTTNTEACCQFSDDPRSEKK